MAAPIIVAGGQVVGDPSIYQPWDPSLSQNPDAATQDNRGCPPGWACIYVQDAATGDLARVCRVLDQSVLGPNAAQTIRNETAPQAWDQAIINVADATRSIVNAFPSMTSTTLLVVAVAVLLFVWKK